MKLAMTTLLALCLAVPAFAQGTRQGGRKSSLLDNDPSVVYMDRSFDKPVMLKVAKEGPVYSDKDGRHKLGDLKAGQTVKLEAMTDRAYKVRGQGTRDGIAGWVPPWAFTVDKDPKFVENLKKLYDRQIEVNRLIEERQVAVGMTIEEVEASRGKPTKTQMRRTEQGQSGKWEFIDYEEEKNYVTRIDPLTRMTYRELVSVTTVEKGKTVVEFVDNVVSAVEESEDRRRGGNVRIIIPPVVFGW